MKEKPVFTLIASMAVPMVISMLVNALYNIVDSFFVAQISEKAMTALSLVYPVQNLINAAAIGFGVGINARISYHLGAGNRKKADAAATWGVFLSFVHGLLLTAAGMAVIRWFLGFFTTDTETVTLGLQYSYIAFSFSLPVSLELAFEKIFQATGRMKTTMAIMLSGCVCNLILDPLLIFGPGFFPRLGIKGAALATGTGQVLTLILYLLFYRFLQVPVSIHPKFLKEGAGPAGRLYSIGIPAALNLALPSFMITALNTILASWSSAYIVILGSYYKLQTFLYLPASGIVQGMRPVIGYNYGAGEKKRVSRIYSVTLCMCGAIMILGTLLCLLIPGQLMSLFTDNPDTQKAGAFALRIISAGFLVSSVSVTSSGALEGIGEGFASLLISLCRYGVLILPCALLLSRVLGPVGVWHSFWITELCTAFFSITVYRRTLKKPLH